MKKIIIPIIISILLVISGFFVFKYFSDTKINNTVVKQSEKLLTPSRQAEINGYVISIEGNDLTIANEQGLKELTEEEKKARQNMTPEERQALRAQETANLTKENININIPIGVPILKGKGDGSGENILADLSEIQKGVYVSIWKTEENIEVIKLKGVSGQ